MLRTVQTAKLAGLVPFVTDGGIRECDLGEFEKKPIHDLVNYLNNTLAEVCFPNGESRTDLIARVKRTIQQDLQMYGSNTLFVSHGMVYWALLEILNIPFHVLDNATLMQFTYDDKNEKWTIKELIKNKMNEEITDAYTVSKQKSKSEQESNTNINTIIKETAHKAAILEKQQKEHSQKLFLEAKEWLVRTYPKAIDFGNPKPLIINVDQELQNTSLISLTQQRKVLSHYVNSLRYHKAVANGKWRYNLQGKEVAEISEKHKEYAAQQINNKTQHMKGWVERKEHKFNNKAATVSNTKNMVSEDSKQSSEDNQS